MTARQVYEAVLIELNKSQAPNLLLEDFNYFFNKAVDQYVNRRYNIYDINQQTTDDVRVLKSTVTLEVADGNNAKSKNGVDVTKKGALYNSIYEFDLPTDYLHLLNCICEYKVLKPFKCYDANTYVQFSAERLTADSWSTVINNVYTRPTYKRPYYYLHNVNRDLLTTAQAETTGGKRDYTSHFYNGTSGNAEPTQITANPTDPYGPDISTIGKEFTDSDTYGENVIDGTSHEITDKNGNPYANDKSTTGGVSRVIDIRNVSGEGSTQVNAVEKIGQIRYGNPGNVRIEIRYGKDSSLFQLERVYVDYIKAPQHIRLSQEQLDLTEDTSQMMEFPDYVCQEIINELVHIVMENGRDDRLNTHVPVSQSIANPAQQ
jgi:hypothetical protein